MRAFLFAVVTQQVGGRRVQRFSKFCDHDDGGVSYLPLNTRYISSIDLCSRGKFFLRDIQPFAGRFDISGQNRAYISHEGNKFE